MNFSEWLHLDRTQKSMNVNVILKAWRESDSDTIRTVEIPASEYPTNLETYALLELVFRYGQNDFQPMRGKRSVSVGDIILIPNTTSKYVVDAMGFSELAEA